MPQVIIATALLLEARVIARAFQLPTQFSAPMEEGPGVKVVVVGPRGCHLDRVRGLAGGGGHGLIMAGLGGALSRELGVGDVVVHGDVPACFPGMQQRVFVGPITSSEVVVATPAGKRELYERTGALAVDMETAAAKALADRMQIPFLAVRAISDRADQELAADLLTLVDANGSVRTGRALGLLLRRPWRVREMMALQHASNAALRSLAATVEALVRAGWPRTA